MDEQEWLACADPEKMLAFLLSEPAAHILRRRLASHRKRRLLACASCRRIEELLLDNRSWHALDVSERFADGLASEEELRGAYVAATDAAEELADGAAARDSHMAGVFAIPSTGWKACGLAARAAAEAAAPLRPETAVATSFQAAIERGAAIDGTTWAVAALGAPARVWLVRDLFGNPFRPVSLSPEWRTENVLAIARAAYEDRAFERLPILADALEEAGCDSHELLDHCRAEGPHVLGCWALDAVLQK